jgi:hypothetical protein
MPTIAGTNGDEQIVGDPTYSTDSGIYLPTDDTIYGYAGNNLNESMNESRRSLKLKQDVLLIAISCAIGSKKTIKKENRSCSYTKSNTGGVGAGFVMKLMVKQ